MQTTEIISLYTEMTPNPESRKFVLNKMLLTDKSVDFPDEASAKTSPLAQELFAFPFVKGVFVSNNFVTISKQPGYDWFDIEPSLKDFIREYAMSDKLVVDEEALAAFQAKRTDETVNEGDIEKKIREILDTYIKPAVQGDGGNIQFKSFNEGVVKLILQGSCSGCPSSVLTLKAGIEGLLKRMVPEVQEVVAEDE